MADRSNQCSTTKISGFRKGPKLRSWIWCIVIHFVTTLPCLFSTRIEKDLSLVVFPDRDINLVYGQPLEIYCTAENNYTSSDLKFSIGDETIDSEVVNSTTRRLYIENVERQVNTYYCRNTRSNKRGIRRVVVDTAPEDVTDFKCISKNFESLKCFFTTPQLISNVKYNLSFSVNDNIVNPPCTARRIANTNTRYCEWNTTSSIPRYRQGEEQMYFNLHAYCDHFGTNNQTFIIEHFEIVKPDPPLELKIVKNGSHSVTLEWKLPNNILDFLHCGVDHIIEYQIAKIDNRTYFHRVNTTLPPKNQTYRYQLANLPYAHVQYEVRVYIKSKRAISTEFLSNFSYLVFYTLSEKPSRPPELIAGSFDFNEFVDRRVIIVYWKQLEEYEESGSNFTYKVVTTQGNTSHTLFPDTAKGHLGYIQLNTSFSGIHVNVWSSNCKGSSANSSYIYIPPDNQTKKLKPKSFTKLAYENGTYELSWKKSELVKQIDNYTLFWCQHNSSKLCSGRIDFTVLSPDKEKHVIDLPNQYRYQFAIAANSGSASSGMVWQLYCDISKDGYIMYGFVVHLSFSVPGKRFVTIQWDMDCAVAEGIILGYNISYCPIVETSSNCDPTYDHLFKYVDNPKSTSTRIDNLRPFKTYQFTLALKTIYGLKNIENATCMITTSEDVPTKPINVHISDVKNDSLVIAWDPPEQKNGIIGKYVILNYDTEFYVDNVPGTDKSGRTVRLTRLQSYTNYSLAVKACNIPLNVCSEVNQTDYIYVRTRIGPPGRLKAPNVKNSGEITWERPEYPGGTLDMYQIRRVKDESEAEIYNSTDFSYALHQCEGGVSSETYEVRALNFDEDYNHGVRFINNVDPPQRTLNDTQIYEFPGEWSEPSTVACRGNSGLAILSIFAGIFAAVGVAYGSIKIYKSYRKMEDIKPVLPHGLGEPEKDISKYTFGSWNPNNKEEKPSSDEMRLLPESKSITTSTDVKQKDSNGDTSDQTDSTALSDSSKGTIDRQASTSDDGSDSSLNLEIEPIKMKNDKEEDDEASSVVDTESSCENSPYLSKETLKKNPTSGYIQQPAVSGTGYVPAQLPVKNPQHVASPQPASSSYVMASLPPPTFSGGAPSITPNPISTSSGYVLREEPQAKLILGKQPPKTLGADTLPNAPSLPPAAKIGADSSYMQLQSLDSLPSFKPSIRNSVPLKPAASGYVSPTDQVINKHLNNILTAGQHPEESAILDPAMSPDAYCRFSWSTDPANDNLHSLLADSPSRTSKN